MKFGNYWDDDQILLIVRAINSPVRIFEPGEPGMPAFVVKVINATSHYYLFVEIIPNTERMETYLDLDTGTYVNDVCALTNTYKGDTLDFSTMTLQTSTTLPLAWFNLKAIPPTPFNAVKAYERAMAIVGG